MVERLKIAVEKARKAREQALAERDGVEAPEPRKAPAIPATGSQVQPGKEQDAALEPGVSETAAPDDAALAQRWAALDPIELKPKVLERNRVITADRTDPAHGSFDVLRTRILRAFAKRGWTRLGITSPGKGCGKTFISTNLAFSFSRHPDNRTILMDMDLRLPSVAKTLGVADPEPISWFLKGDASHTAHLRRHGDNLALGLNSERVGDAAELIQSASAAEALDGMRAALNPALVIYDLPPMLSCDDVFGFLPQLDCVLLIVGGGTTKGSEVTECERLLADQTHLLGVLLNKADGASSVPYAY